MRGSKLNLAEHMEDPSAEFHDSDKPSQKRGLTCTIALATLVTTLGASFQYGYGTGVLTAPSPFIQDFYNQSYTRYGDLSTVTLDILWATTISVYCVGGAFGALAAAPIGDILGRKGGLLINNIFGICAALLFGFSELADSFEMIIIGRVVLGFYAGVGITIVPIFLAEISPKNLRGAIGNNHQLAITIGILVAQVLGIFALNTEDTWVILLAIPGGFSILMLLFLPCCPESPRWLLGNDRNLEGAEKALIRYLSTDDVTWELKDMKKEFAEEQKEAAVGVTGLFTNKNYRKPLIISICMHAGQQFSGINAIFFYATEIYQMIWPNNEDAVLYATVGTGAINVLVTIISILVVEKAGRRGLLLFPFLGMILFTALITVALNLADPAINDPWDYVSLACVYGYIVCFAIGPGPIPFVLVAEIWSQGPRPAAMSLSVQVNWWSNFIVGLSFPFIQGAIGAYTFLVFMFFLLLTAFFTYFMVPETKNKTFEEIVASFRVDKDRDGNLEMAEVNDNVHKA
ncbi:solute carrier family 2, facilitated glucose transporter member 5-like [Ptychodera flava]|uniref:solute carrier family 2, facilitated glucose transporter member 5-like n=1 Tax=Ptychodera flava TaxID=63121 RepID=UPI00396A0192